MFKKTLFSSAVLAATLSLPGIVSATNLNPFKTVFDTDFTAAGYGGMRDIGTGSIGLSGVSGTISEAYLYWHGPTNANATDTNANANVLFNGNNVSGIFFGISSGNCWGFSNSMAYRADVTSWVTGNGNYSLANFTKNNNQVNVNGASLIVFYKDADTTNNRDVVMFDGNDSNIDNSFDASGWNITLAGINYSAGSASMQLHVSDGQSFDDDALKVNASTLVSTGPIFSGDSVPRGLGGPDNGGLWDIKDYDVTSLLSPGLNSLNFTTGVNSDCLSCVLIAISLPAGAAPEQPGQVPEPASLALFGLGLAGLGFMRRRRT